MKLTFIVVIAFLISCNLNNSNIESGDSSKNIKEGYIDKNGWKQGVHKKYSGSWLEFKETYVNDTLSGPLTAYTEYGTILYTGFFKNNKRDSLWTIYFPNGSIYTIKNYNEGIKQGEHKEFFNNGKIKYEAVFNSDTIVGETKKYFKNGKTKAKGNNRNGTYTTYHLNGKIASVMKFKNGKLKGKVVKYNKKGEMVWPTFIKQFNPDTNVINKSNLNIYLMFEQTRNTQRLFRFGRDFHSGAKVCLDKTRLVLNYGSENIIIKENGVELKNSSTLSCDKELKSKSFGINRVVKELPNNEWDVQYIKKDVEHKTSLGNLVVHVIGTQCDDTGINPVTLKRKEGDLEILNIDNLQFFEYDVNKDGKKELYILSYVSCMGYLKIYKIA